LAQGSAPSRRLTSRVETGGEVWVYWQSNGREDVSRVREMSWGGLFIETDQPRAPGITAKLHFLVQEGQIRAESVVRHAVPGIGLGLKFLAVNAQDRRQLAALMTRLRGLSHSSGNRKKTLPDSA
jgi:PilZ domain-containing protein